MGEATYIQIKQVDGYITKLSLYESPMKKGASILILHGMAEHQDRYQHFVDYLNRSGYDVYIYDHRGHGKERRLFELGYIASENGHQLVVSDVITITEYIKRNHCNDKLFLLGHSMGSLIARNVIQSYDQYDGIILTGTMFPPKLMVRCALGLAIISKKFKGAKKLSPFLNNLLFGNKYYSSLSSRTVFDWLTRSNPIVGAYIHDPYCGFICTTSFYQDLLTLTLNSSRSNLILKTRKDIPLFLLSGEKDAVSSYGKEIKKYLAVLKDLEFTNVNSRLYKNCRHEILNELNREEIYSDLSAWVSDHL